MGHLFLGGRFEKHASSEIACIPNQAHQALPGMEGLGCPISILERPGEVAGFVPGNADGVFELQVVAGLAGPDAGTAGGAHDGPVDLVGRVGDLLGDLRHLLLIPLGGMRRRGRKPEEKESDGGER